MPMMLTCNNASEMDNSETIGMLEYIKQNGSFHWSATMVNELFSITCLLPNGTPWHLPLMTPEQLAIIQFMSPTYGGSTEHAKAFNTAYPHPFVHLHIRMKQLGLTFDYGFISRASSRIQIYFTFRECTMKYIRRRNNSSND